MDLRPQAHDIIRTWLFSTVVRADYLHDSLPWRHAAVSGWVLDPDRKKMSKSKGNVVTPMALLEEHGSDGVRYWAACAKPGTDTAFEVGQMKVGRRLATKVLNASRFALLQSEPQGNVTQALDKSMLTSLGHKIEAATKDLEGYDYATALHAVETSFWGFCDDYIELVKARRYGDFGPELAASANTALRTALSVYLRLFAPYLPFVTEEVWSWWQQGSIHRSAWPSLDEIRAVTDLEPSDRSVYQRATDVVGWIRREKSLQKLKTKDPVVVFVDAPSDLALLIGLAAQDIKAAANAVEFTIREAPVLNVDVKAHQPAEPRV
jgi:valyl-tRNA synthetase